MLLEEFPEKQHSGWPGADGLRASVDDAVTTLHSIKDSENKVEMSRCIQASGRSNGQVMGTDWRP